MQFVDMFIGDSQSSFKLNYRWPYFKKELLHLETDKALKPNFRSALWDLGELYYAQSHVAEQDSLHFIRNYVKVLLRLSKEDDFYDQKTPKIRSFAESLYATLQIPSVPLHNLAVYILFVSVLETSALGTGLLLETSVDNNRTVLQLMRISQICPMTIEYHAAIVPHHESKMKLFFVSKKSGNPEDKFVENVIQMKNGCENTCRKHVLGCPEPEVCQRNQRLNKNRTRSHAGLNKSKFPIDISKKPDRKGEVAFDGQRREDKHTQFDPRSSVIAKPNRESGSHGEDVAHEASEIHFYSVDLRKLAMVDVIQPIENLDTKSLHPVLASNHLLSSNRNLSRAAQEKADMGISSWLLHRFPPREPHRLQRPHTAPLPGTTVAQTRQEFRRRMRERNFRIASMVHLPGVRHVPMSEAGLYLDEDDDVFRCYCCSLEVARTEWPVEEDPRDVHRKLSPECPVVNPKAPDTSENSQEGQT